MNIVTELPYRIDVDVIFRDLDALGHVNNAMYFTYMETARTSFFVEQLKLEHPGQLPVIVAETSCTYKSAARFGDRLSIGMGVSRIGQRSFNLTYQIDSLDGRLIAFGYSAMVTYDYAKGRSIKIPTYLLPILEAYQVVDAKK